MSVPEHTLLSFRGHMGTDPTDIAETWSVGLRMVGEDAASGGGPVYSAANLLVMANATKTFIQETDMKFSGSVYFDEIRAYLIGTNGKMTAEPLKAATAEPAQGLSNVNYMPWQVSNVVSMHANGLGKGKRGRIYLPPQNIDIGNNGLMTQGQVDSQLRAVHRWFNAINAVPSGGAVGSRIAIIGSTGGAGTARTVRHVRMGRVLDTQRRRRRSLSESYSEILDDPGYGEYVLAG